MRILTLLPAVFVLIGFFAKGQNNNYYYENAIYNENIKTVRMYRDGFELSNPVLELGSDTYLIFSFDDFSADLKNYYYTVVHCDANWNESFLMQPDYLDGFTENPLNDYKLSFNTTFDYANYQLALPNEDIQFKISGNYVLVVYEDSDMKKVAITQRFYVYEPLTEVRGSVHRATLDAFEGENQEVDFEVDCRNAGLDSPENYVKVVIMQNNRWDNAITDLKPLYIRDNLLIYDYDKENVFPGGNEFRYFDNRSNQYNGENVVSTEFFDPYFHKTLKTDEVRANKDFFQYKDMDGKYTIESQDANVRDFTTECDYTFVHFTLALEAPLLGGTVNVFGALTGWNANKSNEMTWNFEKSIYELTLLLKQGYYNFQYAYVPKGSSTADLTNIEGSFWETENDYQVFVYYRDPAGRADRLVGYRQLNSIVNRQKRR